MRATLSQGNTTSLTLDLLSYPMAHMRDPLGQKRAQRCHSEERSDEESHTASNVIDRTILYQACSPECLPGICP